MKKMEGQVATLPGAGSGIGRATALLLAAEGATVVLAARRAAPLDALAAEIIREGGRASARTVDVGNPDQAIGLARWTIEHHGRVDVLINNAGALFNTRRVTPEGLELTFALNHMSYFLMTCGLRERLLASAPARVVNTASGAHRRVGALDFDDLQMERGYRGLVAYSRSKLCNILYTRELARRLAGTGVTANSLHPGFVATRFGDASGGFFAYVVRAAKLVSAISLEKGAETLVYLASSPDVATISGGYFFQNPLPHPTRHAQDDPAARRLWDLSDRLA